MLTRAATASRVRPVSTLGTLYMLQALPRRFNRQPAGGRCRPVAAGGADRLDSFHQAWSIPANGTSCTPSKTLALWRVRGSGSAEAAARHPGEGVRAIGLPHFRPARAGGRAAGDRAGAGLHPLVAQHPMAGLGAGRLDRAVHHRLHHRTLPAQSAAADPLAVEACRCCTSSSARS